MSWLLNFRKHSGEASKTHSAPPKTRPCSRFSVFKVLNFVPTLPACPDSPHFTVLHGERALSIFFEMMRRLERARVTKEREKETLCWLLTPTNLSPRYRLHHFVKKGNITPCVYLAGQEKYVRTWPNQTLRRSTQYLFMWALARPRKPLKHFLAKSSLTPQVY